MLQYEADSLSINNQIINNLLAQAACYPRCAYVAMVQVLNSVLREYFATIADPKHLMLL
jgi:hypothetical protein